MLKKLLNLISNFGKFVIKAIEDSFNRFGKNATGETIKSLRNAIDVDVDKGIELDTLGSKVFEYIVNGRPAGSKLPPQGVLVDWLQARGIPLAAEFPIRRAIAENGILPVPVIETAFIEVRTKFEADIAPDITRSIALSIFDAIKKGFQFPDNKQVN